MDAATTTAGWERRAALTAELIAAALASVDSIITYCARRPLTSPGAMHPGIAASGIDHEE